MQRPLRFSLLAGLATALTTAMAQAPLHTAPATGMVVPVLTDTEMNERTSTGQGELVFNKTEQGFYFFNGERWEPLLKAEPNGNGGGINWVVQRVDHDLGMPKLTTGTSGFWDLTGNAATDPATNFLGTTDGKPLRLRVNNLPAGILSETALGTVSFGRSSGTGGTENSFFGNQAGGAITTGGGNTLLGDYAGGATTSGNSNVMAGYYAGQQNTSGNANVIIGMMAGKLANASGNVIIGETAGGATDTGGNNVFVGRHSGGGNTSGAGIVTLGNDAGVGAVNLSNSSAIGQYARVDTSNSMVLGSISGISGATNTVNVGIGITKPLDRLHVAGNIRMVDGSQGVGKVLTSDANGKGTWQPIPAASNVWNLLGNAGTNATTNFMGTTDAVDLRFRTSNTARMSITSAGNVGINTTAPADRLHVVGNIRMVDGNQAVGRVLTSDANGKGSWQALPPQSRDWTLVGNAGTDAALNFIGTTDAIDLRFRTNNLERMSITNAGKVGIGTTTPVARLQVDGALVLQPSAITLIAGAMNVTVADRSVMRISTTAAGSSAQLSDGLYFGQLLIIQNAGTGGGALGFDIVDNPAVSNCELVATRTIGLRDTITLMWDGTDWVEIAFSAN